PTADFTADRIISCAGETISFTDLSISSSVISNWVWDFGDEGSSIIENPTYQYNQTGNFDVTLIVGEGICTDTLIKNYYIEIIEPSSFFELEYNCIEPLMVNFSNQSSGADVVEWDFGDGFTSTDFDPIHVYSNYGVYNVSLKVTNNATLCTHEYIEQIKVFLSEADFTYFVNSHNSAKDSVVCLNLNKNSYIEVLSQNVRNYRVDWGDGYLGFHRVDHLYDAPGIYDVTLMIQDDHNCRDTLVIEDMFRVTTVETDFAITNVQGCNALTVDFEDLSSVTSNVIWDFGDGNSSFLNNPSHVYTSEGLYDVTLFSISVDGCKDTLERKEYVQFQHLALDFIISDNQICKNTEVSFTDLSEGMSLVYHWDFGDGTISTDKNPQHIYNNIGTFPLMLIITDTFGCSLIDNFIFIEVQDVEADFISSGVNFNCHPLITNFTNQSSGNIVNYLWDFGDGNTSNYSEPSHLYTSSDSFDVQLIIEDNFNCKDTLLLVDLILISGITPSGYFTLSENIICKDDNVEFIANVQNTDLYLWDFGDGSFSTDSNPTHTYTSGNYFHPILVLENSSSCQLILSSEDSIDVREIIVDAGNDNTICQGDSIEVSVNGNGTIYFWDNSPYITDLNSFDPVMFPTNSTMFYVTSSDGMCFVRDSIFIHVYNNIPQPFFTTDKMCYLDSMKFFGNSGISASAFDWEWTILGENLYSQNSFFKFDTIGVCVVDLLVTNLDNGCDNLVQQTIEVLPLPLVDFSTDEVCFGKKTNFTNLSENSIIASMWSFGNGFQSSFDMNPTCQFSYSGVFNSTLVVQSSNGCLNVIEKEVIVHEIPEIELSVSTECEGDETFFNAFTNLEDSEISVWNWNFGDNTILSDNQFTDHIYNTFGVFNVHFTATSIYGCSNSLSGIAEVNPRPIVDFTVEKICEGDQTQFINSSNVPTGGILSYDWDFSEGNTSNYMNPSNVFSSGIYPVTLTVKSVENCLSILQENVHIHSIPQVDFLVDREVCEDIEVNFVDNTITDGNIIFYSWDFGDRNTSEDKNPKNIYKHSGMYDVSLYIKTEFGCQNSITKLEYIQVSENPIASFDMTDNRVSLLNSEFTFLNTSSDESLFFEWDFDNGIINSTDSEIAVSFEESGTYDVLLYIENDFGCYDEIIHSVQVDDVFSVFVPTAFTPNGDGLNDVFLAKGSGISNFEMKIYDRWGELVYVSENIEFGWDGKVNHSSDVMENGTYMYHVYVTDYNEKPWVYNGELNLMK
ncbi:MAG: PKD domain-containing protein, partial [Flavobacteriales bacterium]